MTEQHDSTLISTDSRLRAAEREGSPEAWREALRAGDLQGAAIALAEVIPADRRADYLSRRRRWLPTPSQKLEQLLRQPAPRGMLGMLQGELREAESRDRQARLRAQVVGTTQDYDWDAEVEHLVGEANGRRRQRTVSAEEAVALVGRVLATREEAGLSGGYVANSYGYAAVTTRVYAAIEGDLLLIWVGTQGASRSHGRGSPARPTEAPQLVLEVRS